MELTPVDEAVEYESLLDESMASEATKSKSERKKIPEKWSRVISLNKDDLTNLRVFELGSDLTLSNSMVATMTRGKKMKKWSPLFWPEVYEK